MENNELNEKICDGCKKILPYPELCWCGRKKESHDKLIHHKFVPYGCMCEKIPDDANIIKSKSMIKRIYYMTKE